MLKVMIVDDEKRQREGLLKHIPWEDYGMQVVHCAANGVEALEAARDNWPDLVITDVKMPRMNGLELSKALKAEQPDCKIIIISGYEEFEIYKSAIELQAQSFLMKPIVLRKMKEELAKINSVFEAERSSRQELRLLQEQLEASKPLLVDQFVRDLLGGFATDETAISERAAFLSLPLPSAGYYILSIRPDERSLKQAVEEPDGGRQEFHFALYRLLAEMAVRFGGMLTAYKEGGYGLIAEADESRDLLTDRIDAEKVLIEEKLSRTLTIGISKWKGSIGEAGEGYREAEMALRQRFYLGKGKTIFFDDLGPLGTVPPDLEQTYQDMVSSAAIGDHPRMETRLDEILTGVLRLPPALQEQHMKVLCFRVISDVQRILHDSGERSRAAAARDGVMPASAWDDANRLGSILDMRDWVAGRLSAMVHHIHGDRSSRHSTVIHKVKQILESDYGQSITIQDLAQKVFLTPNYLCNVFKEHVGESIIEHLTKIRMKHAKQLLAGTPLKIYEIAEQTGFKSLSYFGLVFKNMFGLSPKEYRDALLPGESDRRTGSGGESAHETENEV
ncbi:response regulator [Paenibacillus mendelii]|uniref:Response regulator n=1 Tax=Paenibacillus mendelii TaxID=206163 RepID=A0ABV6JLA2_9BACL|nr:response regulator [Paenibacillus mendelii]MCQ6562280.1 response regulator [Paenibacillus mendelii]